MAWCGVCGTGEILSWKREYFSSFWRVSSRVVTVSVSVEDNSISNPLS